MEINGVAIDDTYAEAFPTWVSRVIITAVTEEWAYKAAVEATGYATSAIGCPCEAGIEMFLSGQETPDGRPGVAVLFCASKKKMKEVLLERIGECILTAPTTAVFDGLPGAEERVKTAIHFFGDGYEEKREIGERKVWAIPIMGGWYIGEEDLGMVKGVAGGNFFVMGENQVAALMGAQAAVDAIAALVGVITPFPGGIVSSGSKVGTKAYEKYGFAATTNEKYCPAIKDRVEDSEVPGGVKAIYEIVIDGIDEDSVKQAMAEGIQAATTVPGVVRISAGNFGGSLGPYKFNLKDIL